MKIRPNTTQPTAGTAAQTAEAARAKANAGKTTATPNGVDAVKLSPQSARLNALASGLSEPQFDRAKVDQIKQAIQDGKLHVNTAVVADKMIEDVKARLAKGSV